MYSGTPNSTTTSLSALSTTAIKDGHKGQAPPHTHHHSSSISSSSSTNTLDAERADRISRLAGLERVVTTRQGPSGFGSNLTSGGSSGSVMQQPPPGYFDDTGNILGKERSTVGSASATGSVGGQTTWADGSDVYDADKMSEDQDDGISCGGFSDEGNGSLVGFGEAASTTSGPVSSSGRVAVGMARTGSGFGSPSTAKMSGYFPRDGGSPMQGIQTQGRNANMTGQETAERIIRERLNQAQNSGIRPMSSSDGGSGL